MVSLLSAGYGGAVATRDRELYGRLKLIRNHGVARDGGNDYVERGFNFRFSDLLAAIGNGQFGRLGERIEHVRTVYRRYSQGLSRLRHVRILPVGVDSGEVPLCTEIRSIRRDELLGYLARHDVEAMKFHRPVHLAPYLQARGDFPNASAFSEEGLILPCGPSQSLENVDRCIDLIRQWDSAVSPP
jgi:dTDP-4-amino-4,6-dideoxygalactose transaminase